MNFERIKQIAVLNNLKIWAVKVWQEVEIHEKIKEWKNERIWKFKGLIIKVKKGNSHDGTFTVRGKVLWITVEKIYPLSSNIIEKIILLDEKKLKRAKLYYIRGKIGKEARLKSLLSWEISGKRWTEIEKIDIKVNLVKTETKENSKEEVSLEKTE